MKIGFLHTSNLHVATFERLLPGVALEHVVREDLLARARDGGAKAVAAELRSALEDLAARCGRVMCTCSTLGAIVDEMGQAKIMRIDRPAMELAAAEQGVLVAICLKSTLDATELLWQEVAGRQAGPVHLCEGAWERFEAGDMEGFAEAIAASVLETGAQAVLLAQASMAVARGRLEAAGLTVITTPEAAAAALLR